VNRLHRALFALALPVAVAGRPPAQAPPEFTDGDPSRLKCRVLKVEPTAKGSSAFVLTVQVSNPGTTAAEPLLFELTTPRRKAPVVLARALHPWGDRAGRAVPAGDKRSYWLQIVRAENELKDLTARVLEASFFRGTGAATAPVRIGAIRHEDANGTPVSVIDVENLLAERVDVVIALDCEEPWRGRSLARLRLEPSAKLAWRPVDCMREFVRGDSGGASGAKVTAAKVLDWSVERAPPAGTDRNAEFTAAWNGWLRRPDDAPAVEGRFELEESSTRHGAPPHRAKASGTFRRDARAGVTFTPASPLDAETTNGLKAAFERAFAPVCRKSADAVLAAKGVARVGRGRYRLEPRMAGDALFPRLLAIRDGRCTGWTDVESGTIRERWTTAPLGDGYVVTRMEGEQAALPGLTDVQVFEFALHEGLVVPVLHQRVWALEQGSRSEAALRLRPGPAAAAPVDPAVPLASRIPEPVRKAWDAAYRYPGRAVTLTGRFTIESPATDALWQGHRRLTGRFTLKGFRGWLAGEDRWQEAEFALDLRAPDEVKQQLASVVEDRFRLWAFRDFAGREPAERLFASAVFARVPNQGRKWTVRNCGWSSLEIAGDVIAAYGFGRVPRRTIEYGKLGGTLVPERIVTGEEELLAKFADLGGGWLLPASLEFRRVFGKDWGPETVTFKELKVED
jgi:hypothetical protein